MERRVSKIGLRSAAICLAVGLTLSCGKGISDGRGEVYGSATFDVNGGRLQVGGGTLDLYVGTVAEPATITLRRYEEVVPSGAVGPVYEIELPTPDTLKTNDPRLSIHTTSEVLGSGKATIGFLTPMGNGVMMWVPTTTPARPEGAPSETVFGTVQIDSFKRPGSGTFPPTNLLRMAILMRCSNRSDCGSNQACPANVCQQCIDNSDCNP